MSDETVSQRSASARVAALSLRALPIYSTFFLWGFGTAAQQLARPLFAASFGVPLFLVTLIAANNSFAWIFTAPTTGFLTDRFGRRPLVIVGNLLRGLTCLGQIFVTDYWQFFALEFIGAIGVSMWATGASVVMADITERENRGRANAIRGMAMRLGTATGFPVGGFLIRQFGLQGPFLFNAITKIPIFLIMVLLVRETRPEKPAAREKAETAQDRLDWSVFLRPAVLVLAFATLCYSLAGSQGMVGTLFPVQITQSAGMDPGDAGQMLGIAATLSLLISFPNGWIADRYGRKKSLIPGMLLLGVSGYLLAQASDYRGVLLMIIAYGLGDGASMGAFEVYAMDLAPAWARGAFLGVWQLFRNVGGIMAPLLIGITADHLGMPAAFTMAGALLVAAALLMWAFGPETHTRTRGA